MIKDIENQIETVNRKRIRKLKKFLLQLLL